MTQASDRAVAEQLVTELEGAPGDDRAAIADPLQQAKKALERATSARNSGDLRGAELLEGLSREWAETAHDVQRAAKAEADAGALQTQAAETSLKADRARALLEEAIIRRGRAEAELRQMQQAAETSSHEASPAKTKPKGAR